MMYNWSQDTQDASKIDVKRLTVCKHKMGVVCLYRGCPILHWDAGIPKWTIRLFVQQLVQADNNISKPRIAGPLRGGTNGDIHIHPHKGPVMRKAFPCHNIIMIWNWCRCILVYNIHILASNQVKKINNSIFLSCGFQLLLHFYCSTSKC